MQQELCFKSNRSTSSSTEVLRPNLTSPHPGAGGVAGGDYGGRVVHGGRLGDDRDIARHDFGDEQSLQALERILCDSQHG